MSRFLATGAGLTIVFNSLVQNLTDRRSLTIDGAVAGVAIVTALGLGGLALLPVAACAAVAWVAIDAGNKAHRAFNAREDWEKEIPPRLKEYANAGREAEERYRRAERRMAKNPLFAGLKK